MLVRERLQLTAELIGVDDLSDEEQFIDCFYAQLEYSTDLKLAFNSIFKFQQRPPYYAFNGTQGLPFFRGKVRMG